MKPEYILQSDMLDILFENRNKAYGAYYIRRHYNQYLLKALAAMFMLLGVLLFLSGRYDKTKSGSIFAVPDHPPVGPLRPVEPFKFDPPPPKTSPAPKKAALRHFATIKIVPPAETIEESVPDIETLVDKKVALVTVNAPLSGDIMQPPVADQPAGAGKGEITETYAQPFASTGVDEAATYPGGLKAMMRFLQTHLRHINNDKDETLRLRIRFVVAEDGSIADFKVIQSGGENIDLQVIKALQKMPRWKPAKKNGRNVAMYFVQPVTFEVAE
ncbi:TonB family protein [Agriterribacter sp.]|uniref:TonB family protein n=1 Tax=Agriterribacter sp. TaxID=2821509 RepID=UPI002BB1ABBD|nr:TonB family protein [Agriterribacter sp.]HRP56775.1 TonB family protein [Agriterribacter sp.]